MKTIKTKNLVRLAVFEFKQSLYLQLLADRNFNINGAAKSLGFSRTDLYNHLPRDKKKIKQMAAERGITGEE